MNEKDINNNTNTISSTKRKKLKILWQLFSAAFTLSAFTFGGGFVIVSLMKKKFVEELGWLSEDEMLDITAIAQSSPGPIPINACVILGYRMCGIFGSIAGVLGTALPPMIVISIVSIFYAQFRENKVIAVALAVMRAGVAAVIFDVVINLAKNVIKTKRALYILLMAAAFAAKCFFKVSAMLVIFTCLFIGLCDCAYSVIKKKKDGKEGGE